jgi:S-adenosylmethionine hydrolase
MKGVILSLNPAARVIDLTHQIPPQGVRHAGFFLASAVPYFPDGVIHVIVVDPGVGSDRALLCVELGGATLLAPDNGCWTPLDDGRHGPPRVTRLTERRFWREPVSATFHGRDILAPVAAHLSRGVRPGELGPEVGDWVRLPAPAPRALPDGLEGEVVFVDDFGNLITNLPGVLPRRPDRLTVGDRTFRRRFRWVRTYADAEPGALVVLTSSQGALEVAVVQGNAARRLRARVGTAVRVGWDPTAPAG